MKAITYSEWPKFPRRPDITTVGRFDGTIEQFAAMLNAESKEFVQKASREGPEHRYRTIFFRLNTGAYGALMDESLPEDWWNQVQVSPSKRPSQRKKRV